MISLHKLSMMYSNFCTQVATRYKSNVDCSRQHYRLSRMSTTKWPQPLIELPLPAVQFIFTFTQADSVDVKRWELARIDACGFKTVKVSLNKLISKLLSWVRCRFNLEISSKVHCHIRHLASLWLSEHFYRENP